MSDTAAYSLCVLIILAFILIGISVGASIGREQAATCLLEGHKVDREYMCIKETRGLNDK